MQLVQSLPGQTIPLPVLTPPPETDRNSKLKFGQILKAAKSTKTAKSDAPKVT